MAQRFDRLYELPGGLYAPGAPVLIRAGALLQDRRTRNVLLQLKFYNLDAAVIDALTVALDFPELPGVTLKRSYTRLDAATDEEFGQEKALILPHRSVRSFRVRVICVEFADGDFWDGESAVWESVPKAQTLEDALGSEEMADQFRAHYGTDCVYMPQRFGDLWQCTCGTLNTSADERCRNCPRPLQSLLDIDLDALRAECERHITREAEEAEEPPAERKLSAAWWIVPLLVLGVLLLVLLSRALPRLINDIAPLPTVTPEVFETPEPPVYTLPPTPEITPEPTLSPEELMEQDYNKAAALLEEKNYSAARAAFLRLGDYRDSAELAQEAVYRKAVALLDFIREQDERDIYALLTMDARGTNRFVLSNKKALALGSEAISSLRAACGKDSTDFQHSDTPPGSLKPLAACVKDLLLLLDGYGDSAALLEELELLTDYTRDFYMLLEAGDIDGAYNWLVEYNGVFDGKDHWLQLLELYKPFCGNWGLLSGDPTLIPYSAQRDTRCVYFNSRVIISGETATLRLLFTEGEDEYHADLTADTGSADFLVELHGVFYVARINTANNFVYMKYYGEGIQGSVEYNRVA